MPFKRWRKKGFEYLFSETLPPSPPPPSPPQCNPDIFFTANSSRESVARTDDKQKKRTHRALSLSSFVFRILFCRVSSFTISPLFLIRYSSYRCSHFPRSSVPVHRNEAAREMPNAERQRRRKTKNEKKNATQKTTKQNQRRSLL